MNKIQLGDLVEYEGKQYRAEGYCYGLPIGPHADAKDVQYWFLRLNEGVPSSDLIKIDEVKDEAPVTEGCAIGELQLKVVWDEEYKNSRKS